MAVYLNKKDFGPHPKSEDSGAISEGTLEQIFLGKETVGPLLPAGTCGQAVAMHRLVSADRKVYTISDLKALSEFVAGLRLNSTLASNLRGLPNGWQ